MTGSVWAADADRLRAALSLYLAADPEQSASGDLVGDTAAALSGGVSCVQLRAKHLSDRDAFNLGTEIAALCRQYGVPFLLNDRLDVALAVEADGVHVGLTDLPIVVLRKLTGNRMLIGWSPETIEQAATSMEEGADYVGIGPVFATSSKADAGDAIGLDGLTSRARAAGIPSVGIGGITVATAASVIHAGADGTAVISAILRTDSPARAAADLRAVVDDAVRNRRQ